MRKNNGCMLTKYRDKIRQSLLQKEFLIKKYEYIVKLKEF
jgi:hypothetical protein